MITDLQVHAQSLYEYRRANGSDRAEAISLVRQVLVIEHLAVEPAATQLAEACADPEKEPVPDGQPTG